MIILGIDPGNIDSAYVLVDSNTYRPIIFAKVKNESLRELITFEPSPKHIAIEMIASYGLAVGKEVFDTCVEIGRYIQIADFYHIQHSYVYRKDVKLNLCGSPRAKDSNIIQALKDRFGDKGTKSAPGFFFGFSKDVWQAYAMTVTWIDDMKAKGVIT